MANTLSPYFPEFWSKTAQVLHKPRAIYRQIANFRAEPEMKFGDTFHRILPNTTGIQNYQRYTDIFMQSISGTDQQLVVDKQKAFGFQVDDLDEVQANLNLATTYSQNAIRDLTNTLDSDFLYEVLNATSLVDDGTIGGTAGNPIPLSGSNVFDTISRVHEDLAIQNIDLENLYGVIDPSTFQVIMSQNAARETPFGDTMTQDGYLGNKIRYAGIDLYVTNNYTRSIQLNLATQPTDGDTVTLTVQGTAVTFTFKTVLGSTAGNVLIGGSADAARANLVALINAPGTTTANGVAFSEANQIVLQSVTATNDNTANTATIYAKGKTLVGTETLTDATDGFDATQASNYLMFGQRGAVDGVVQVEPKMEMRMEPKQFTTNILGLSLYGFKTFTDGAQALVNVRVLS